MSQYFFIVGLANAHLSEQLRQQTQSLFQKEGLVGRIAHDLRNPLSSISMRSELLLQSLPADSPVRAEVQAILRSCQRMKSSLCELKNTSAPPPARKSPSQDEPSQQPNIDNTGLTD